MTRKMKWLGALALMVGAGYFGLQKYGIAIPGMIAQLREPIADNHPVIWSQGPAKPPAGQRPPNVILIVADDLGMNDISLYGGGVAGGAVPTPNIDAIARQGVSFANGYAANATCSPSRAALMTGRYPTRFGFEFTAVPPAFASNLAHSGGNSPYPPIYHEELNRDLPAYADMGVPHDQIMLPEILNLEVITRSTSASGIWARPNHCGQHRRDLTKALACARAEICSWPKTTLGWSTRSCHGIQSIAFCGRTCPMPSIGETVSAFAQRAI
jgi:hypothetical protein